MQAGDDTHEATTHEDNDDAASSASSEVLIPFDDSSSDDDVPADDTPAFCGDAASLAHLRSVFADALAALPHVCTHNHATRDLAHDAAYAALVAHCATGLALNPHSRPVTVTDAHTLSDDAFRRDFASGRGEPVVIRGIPARDSWKAREAWRADNLLHTLGAVPLKLSERASPFGMGRPHDIRLPLCLYYEYAHSNTADSPFYCFEYNFTLGSGRGGMLQHYSVPDFFQPDVFNVDARTRAFYPNFRHLIAGGPRTGTNLHFDPKGTCAWNTLLCGRKKWAFFPPGTPREQIWAASNLSGTASGAPVGYWWLDRAATIAADCGMIECVQEPGDTVFTPPGWFHVVLNLEFAVAMTQNVLLPSTLASAWPQLKKDWPRFAHYLECVAPDLLDSEKVQAASAALSLRQPPGQRDLSVGSTWEGPTDADDAEFGLTRFQ